MATIIKQGNTHKKATCEHCGCLFEYKPYEIHNKEGIDYVQCPDCLHGTIVNTQKTIKTTLQHYFVCGGNDRERFENFCEKVFEEHEKSPEQRMEIIIMEAE